MTAVSPDGLPAGPLHPELSFQNIKGFADEATVPLAPITLLFGWNSAGKSTVLQALLLLKQTLDFAERVNPSLVVNGSLTHMGSFRNLVHRHLTNTPVHIGVEAGTQPWGSHFRPLLARSHAPVGLKLIAEQEHSESRLTGGEWALRYGGRRCVVPFRLSTRASDQDGPGATRVTISQTDETRSGLVDFVDYVAHYGAEDPSWRHFYRESGRITRLPPHALRALGREDIVHAVQNLKFDDLPVARRLDRSGEGLSFTPDLMSMTRRESLDASDDPTSRAVGSIIAAALGRADAVGRQTTSRIVYLGPFRQPPERLVLLTGEQFSDVGAAGENTIALLARSPQLRADVDRWLVRLGVPYSLAVDALETTREMLGDALVAGLREAATGTAVSIRDVGFGVSQVLPVVVQAIAGRGKLLVVEQPELHVHPRLQAELGDLFVEQSRHNGARFLLETHSEHLILRLLSHVRRGSLSAADLAVLYVDRDSDNNSIIRRLRVDDDGEFVDRWPHGFFTERRSELH